jgi:hypothetical protein
MILALTFSKVQISRGSASRNDAGELATDKV